MTDNHHRPIALIIGASSGIGQAVAQYHAQQGMEVWRITRNIDELVHIDRSVNLACDYSEQSMAQIGRQLAPQMARFNFVVLCHGVLHNDTLFPEKQLRELTEQSFTQSLQVNALLPLLWLQTIIQHLPTKQPCVFTFLSARVGSISDNRLGGWYSYRSSKAALNMLVKTAAQELKRSHPNVACLLFHPGTTNTGLSRPFQQRVQKDKLFSPEFVAEALVKNSQEKAVAGAVKFIDWAGKEIAY